MGEASGRECHRSTSDHPSERFSREPSSLDRWVLLCQFESRLWIHFQHTQTPELIIHLFERTRSQQQTGLVKLREMSRVGILQRTRGFLVGLGSIRAQIQQRDRELVEFHLYSRLDQPEL